MSPLRITLFDSKGDLCWACIFLIVGGIRMFAQNDSRSQKVWDILAVWRLASKKKDQAMTDPILHRSEYPDSPTNSRFGY